MTERIHPSAPTIQPDGLILFQEVLDKFPTTGLAEAHKGVLQETHNGYLKQKEVGFYPSDMTELEWEEAIKGDPRLLSNNTLIRRRWGFMGSRLAAVSYLDWSSGFRDIHLGIADRLERVTRAASGLPEEDLKLIKDQAELLANGFRTGNTDEAMRGYINQHTLPEFAIGAFLQERLLDRERNLKFAYEGWSTQENRDLSARFNVWAGRLLIDVGKYGDSQFIVCDCAGHGGMAAEFIWQGNTMPSQPDIARTRGHKIFFFDNVSAWKTERDIEPELKRTTPEHILERMENGSIDRVRRADIAGHEIGHAAQYIPEGADLRFGRFYQIIKELYADAFALWAVCKRPEIVMNREDVVGAIYFDIARALAKVTEHNRRIAEGRQERGVIDPYPLSGAIKLNVLLELGALVESGRGTYCITSRDNVRAAIEWYLRDLNRITKEGTQTEAEDYIISRSTHPINHLAQVA